MILLMLLYIHVGVPRDSLVNGGLEVIIYDHHHFSHDINIGGVRLCIPQKKPAKSFSLSPDASPARSQSASPLNTPTDININCKSSLQWSPKCWMVIHQPS